MDRTLIQKYASSVVRSLADRAESLRQVKHNPTKGRLRELLVSSLLKSFLADQFGVGSGVIINPEGTESNEMDIIIYDNGVLPPFFREQGQYAGVYPAESVLATVEVKSYLGQRELLKAESAANQLDDVVYNPPHRLRYEYYRKVDLRPMMAAFGFFGTGAGALKKKEEGKQWLCQRIRSLKAICLLNKYSWIFINGKWVPHLCETKTDEETETTHAETKRFISVLLDNVRTFSESRRFYLMNYHADWLGAYIREWED